MVMPLTITIEGVDRTKERLKDSGMLIEDAVKKALLYLGLMVESRAKGKTPVEYGFLRASAFTERDAEGFNVRVGFSAAYAPYVHEATDEKLRGMPRPSGLGTYWSPGESKFLEKAIEEIRPLVQPTIERFIKAALDQAGEAR